MKRRLFIAINLPDNIKDEIEAGLETIKRKFTGDVRFLDRKNWHVTITFLGYQTDEAIIAILNSLKETGQELTAPAINLAGITYGPIGKSPRMIWLNGDLTTGKALASIKNLLEEKLVENGVRFKQEHRPFKLHITLARFHTLAVRPEINQKLHLQFQPKSLDLMESHLSRQGANYELLQSFPFKL